MQFKPIEPISPALYRAIRDYAQDATIGAGNDSESPSPKHRDQLRLLIGHDPTKVEWDEFLRAWCIFHQMMEQP